MSMSPPDLAETLKQFESFGIVKGFLLRKHASMTVMDALEAIRPEVPPATAPDKESPNRPEDRSFTLSQQMKFAGGATLEDEDALEDEDDIEDEKSPGPILVKSGVSFPPPYEPQIRRISPLDPYPPQLLKKIRDIAKMKKAGQSDHDIGQRFGPVTGGRINQFRKLYGIDLEGNLTKEEIAKMVREMENADH